jgi:hypothetical protein
LKSIVFLLVNIIGTGYSLFIALNLIKLENNQHLLVLYGTQTVIILIISTILAFGQTPARSNQFERGSRAVEQFWKLWSPLWFTWLLLYAGLTSWQIYRFGHEAIPPNVEHLVLFFLHQLNNGSTLIILMLFHILAQPSISESEYPVEGDIFEQDQPRENLPEFKPERIENHGAKLWFWVAFFFVAGVAELGLVLSMKNADSISQVFGIGYGIMAATATALVIGRLDSNLLGVPTLAIVFLFLYAGIQPTFDFLLVSDRTLLSNGAREILLKRNGHLLSEKAKNLLQQSKDDLTEDEQKKLNESKIILLSENEMQEILDPKIQLLTKDERKNILDSKGDPLIKSAQEVIVVIALISKILLFAVIHWISIGTNRLLYYMVQCYTILKRVDNNRRNLFRREAESRKTNTKQTVRPEAAKRVSHVYFE